MKQTRDKRSAGVSFFPNTQNDKYYVEKEGDRERERERERERDEQTDRETKGKKEPKIEGDAEKERRVCVYAYGGG